jgi:hypothetical protein
MEFHIDVLRSCVLKMIHPRDDETMFLKPVEG